MDIIDSKINSISTPWEGYTGARVEEFIKGKLGEIPEVDDELNPNSENAVQNKAVTQRISQLEHNMLGDVTATPNDENTAITLRFLGGNGNEIASCDIPISAGAVEPTAKTQLVLTPTIDNPTIKVGSDVTLSYYYDLVYVNEGEDNESTGTKADIQVIVKNDDTVIFDEIKENVSPGRYSVNLGSHVMQGTNDIFITATWIDPVSKKQQTKTKYTSIRVVQFQLESEFSLGSMLRNGGYGSESLGIPFTVRGAGSKDVWLYVDGEQRDLRTIIAEAPTKGSFTVDLSSLSAGQHSIQLVSTMQADGLTLRSESIYIGIFKQSVDSGICVKMTLENGAVATDTAHLQPTANIKSFDSIAFEYGVWNSASANSNVQILVDNTPFQTITVDRTPQSFSSRFDTQGTHSIQIVSGSTTLGMNVQVGASEINVAETTYGCVAKLSAAGRSNNENPASRSVWADGPVDTTFENVDWSSSGWTGSSLRLLNGAKATVNYMPFAVDSATQGVKAEGCTIETTVCISNIGNEDLPIISCVEDGKGFEVKGNEIAYKTGQIVEYKDENGEDQTRESKLSTNYTTGSKIKIALVIDKASDRRVMHLYVNGNRVGADTYPSTFNFAQTNPVGITFDSTAANIEIESVRIYNRAISDDEELDNDIVDMADVAEMIERFNENDVLNQEGAVDRTKLRQRGKGIMIIVRPNLLDDVYATNDKTVDFAATVMYFSPFGPEYDFVCENCNIRIQGTSSTKYPSKNIRVYLSKGPNSSTPVLTVGGVKSADNKYSLRPGAIPMNLFTAKSDYSDSSMSLNTGGAKLFNDIFKELDLLTPPQRYQAENSQTVTVRSAIDGVPIDMFTAASINSEPIYVGQYNLNNEKSKSAKLFGMELSGFIPVCPITLESLNNGQNLCLFRLPGDVDDELSANFDKSFEFNYPEDVFWSQSTLDDKGKGSLATESQRTAIKRLMDFIKESVQAGADTNDITTFASPYFKEHVAEYFDVPYLLTYYLWTDFFVSVDQRAKNIMWRCWDGLVWYPTYYDGDTQRGKANDSFMAYDPETERSTWDARRNKYAFEGHDSWLWCLCLANLNAEMTACARLLREHLTIERVLNMLLVEQSGNWSDRVFNKSGEIKYITPAVTEVYGKIWPFIFGLQGSDKQHSEWFIRQRWSLMDSKFGIGSYTTDSIDCYLSRNESDPADVVKVTGNKTYSYGYGTNNQPSLFTTGIVNAGKTASIPITGQYSVNDPIRIYGASRIQELDMSDAASHLKNGFDVGKCEALEVLDMHVKDGSEPSSSWWLVNINQCGLLRYIDLSGQISASMSEGTRYLDFSQLTRLEYLNLSNTGVTAVSLAEGAAVNELYVPSSMQSLSLRYLQYLTDANLHIQSFENIKDMEIVGCPSINSAAIVSNWIANKAISDSACSLTLDDVDWTLDDASVLLSIANLNTCQMSGIVRINCALSMGDKTQLENAFPGCFDGTSELNIIHAGELIVLNDTNANPALFNALKAKNVFSGNYATAAMCAAVTALPDECFKNNTEITSAAELRYFTGLYHLYSNTFFGCSNLESVTLPEGMLRIRSSVFQRCAKLRRVVVSSTVTQIDNYSFCECPLLDTLVFMPVTAPSLSSSTFGTGVGNYTGITSKTSGNNVLRVPQNATGYDTGTFADPLCNASKCGFTLTTIL